ncbi:hypothetical protein B0T17DRAFT_591915 [Bombardia bombarda]|uniref:DUF1479-domain-containing protein n=1 Tax=Bombardia bombarda TaxID=252184 RepID=A0AA39WM86_9PEZI|nr:hypothetical protein B0T17DRAFT_591915 [Bombardia bombarda]
MGNSAMPSADKISLSEFSDLLARYPSCIEVVSESKGAKPGQKTLVELDEYRHVAALDAFGSEKANTPMGIDDVTTLVEWKLRHGKFRPTLMKLVASNEADTVADTVQKAVDQYRDSSDVSAALGVLTTLRGIGPATASLLLAVHDGQNVIFFADEAFYWLCCGGSKAPIKYNLKEYMALNERAQALARRLGVKAVDVERVAFVLMREPHTAPARINTCYLDLLARPSKRAKMQVFSCPDPIALPKRFRDLKERLAVSGSESALISSWNRLLQELRKEVELVSTSGSQAVPIIDFADITKPQRVEGFMTDLRKRGVAIIKNVVPRETAVGWRREAREYLDQNPSTPTSPASDPQLYDLYWSQAQIKARAHPNVLAAQSFAMSLWNSEDSRVKVTTNFPVSYADRIRIQKPPRPGRVPASAHVDGGSVERWEPDGYGRAGTYRKIFQGKWEEYDPWESSSRVAVASDLYRGAGSCSILRMFQGWLALDSIAPDQGSLQVCPMLQLATAYYLLRPFFSPNNTTTSGSTTQLDYLLSSQNWSLTRPQNSILHGALPSYAQDINRALHPHLQLDRSLVAIPPLEPGDYVLWHPDLVHVVDGPHVGITRTTAAPAAAATSPFEKNEDSGSAAMYLPACPLTQTNALYLSRQRKAFLLGCPAPDFSGGRGESSHAGRAGVQDVNDAGGDEGLRAMGLLPWDEEDAADDAEREVLAVANSILFPDLYDYMP